MLAGRICQNLIFITFFIGLPSSSLTCRQQRSLDWTTDLLFTTGVGRPVGRLHRSAQIVILKNFVTTEFQCDLWTFLCCTLGVLHNCVPSRVWCTFLPRKMNQISQLWSGSQLNTTETRSRPFVWVFSQVSYQARRFLSITKCSASAIRSKLIKARQTGSIFVSRRTICFRP